MAGGRPTKITPEVVAKLEAAFHIDCTIREACSRADIDEATYYRHIKDDPSFARKMQVAQDWAITSARAILFNSMEKDPKLALEVVKRRDKKRYSERTEQTGEDGGPITVVTRIPDGGDS